MAEPSRADLLLYRWPRRFVEPDTFGGSASAEFAGVPDRELPRP
jgi:hypothetical protein